MFALSSYANFLFVITRAVKAIVHSKHSMWQKMN